MENIEKDVLKELYEDNNWPDIDSSKKEDKIYGVDMASSPSFKSVVTITGSNYVVIVDSKLGIEFNTTSIFNDINNLAKFYKDMGLIE